MKAVFTKKSKKGTYNVFAILDKETGCVGNIYVPVSHSVSSTITLEMVDTQSPTYFEDFKSVEVSKRN